MKLILYLDLFKAAKQPQRNLRGEARGGDYVARVQVGTEKDGSPKYKYFKTIEDRDKFLRNRGKQGTDRQKTKDPKATKEKLKNKLDKEQQRSKEHAQTGTGRVETGKLFVSYKNKNNKKIKKSVDNAFIWRFDE